MSYTDSHSEPNQTLNKSLIPTHILCKQNIKVCGKPNGSHVRYSIYSTTVMYDIPITDSNDSFFRDPICPTATFFLFLIFFLRLTLAFDLASVTQLH